MSLGDKSIITSLPLGLLDVLVANDNESPSVILLSLCNVMAVTSKYSVSTGSSKYNVIVPFSIETLKCCSIGD